MKIAFAVFGQWFFGILIVIYLVVLFLGKGDDFVYAMPGNTPFVRFCAVAVVIAGEVSFSVMRRVLEDQAVAEMRSLKKREAAPAKTATADEQ